MTRFFNLFCLFAALIVFSSPSFAKEQAVSITNGAVIVKDGTGSSVTTGNNGTSVIQNNGNNSVSITGDDLFVKVDGEAGEDTFVEIDEGQPLPSQNVEDEEDRTEEELDAD